MCGVGGVKLLWHIWNKFQLNCKPYESLITGMKYIFHIMSKLQIVYIFYSLRDILKKNIVTLSLTKVKGHRTKQKIHDNFLYVYNTYGVSVSHEFQYICKNCIFDFWPWISLWNQMKSPYINFLSAKQMESLSCLSHMDFQIFVKITFLTFDLDKWWHIITIIYLHVFICSSIISM